MENQWIAIDESRNCVEIWDAFPQWDNALGKYIRGEGQLRGTLDPDSPHWLKPGILWELCDEEQVSNLSSIKEWRGYWWRVVEIHEPHSTVELLIHAARKIENPCDSCKGACESERETVKCSAAKAYDELQRRVAPFLD